MPAKIEYRLIYKEQGGVLILKSKKKKSILLWISTYALFSISGFLFPIDKDWYKALAKPNWTPTGATIGIIWAFLFGLISTTVTIVYYKEGFSKKLKYFLALLSINYLFNQSFSYFQFKLKDLLLATIDSLLVAVTSLLLIFAAKKHSKLAAILLLPYFLWSTFATYLSYSIYIMNKS